MRAVNSLQQEHHDRQCARRAWQVSGRMLELHQEVDLWGCRKAWSLNAQGPCLLLLLVPDIYDGVSAIAAIGYRKELAEVALYCAHAPVEPASQPWVSEATSLTNCVQSKMQALHSFRLQTCREKCLATLAIAL